jgi:TPR repeat protein
MHISKAAISHTMKKLTLATLLIFSCATAWAADFDKGLAAAEAGDYTTALSELKPFAEQGNAVAQYNLAQMYRRGEGVIEDDKEAKKRVN